MDAPAKPQTLSDLEAILRTLPPFTARVVESLVRRGRLEEALKLVQHRQEQLEQPQPSSEEAPPPESAGLLIAEALRSRPAPHPLPCPEEDDPRWRACKARAVRRIKLKSGGRLPFKTHNPRHGERAGPGAFVALLLALMLYYRESEAVRRFPIFAVQWALADVLGVSPDTLQRWQQLPEVRRWVQSWRYLDAGADYKRAGMLYTVVWNPDHPHKRVRTDLLQLPLRSLREAILRGQTRRQLGPERPHRIGSLKARWALILPLNRHSLIRFGPLKEAVEYMAAQATTPTRPRRMAWAGELVDALKRHLGLGDNPEAREKLYWKIALTCLRGLVYGGDEDRHTPLILLRRALSAAMEAQREGRLRNVGAFFSRKLRELGFFDLAAFYAGRRVA